jgi:hypothetical protein
MEIIKGLIRPLIAVSLVAMLFMGILKGGVNWGDVKTFFGIVMTFYFTERAILHAQEANKPSNSPESIETIKKKIEEKLNETPVQGSN